MNTISNNPQTYAGALTALAVALIPFLRACGVNISKDLADSGLTLLTVVIAFGTVIVHTKTISKGEANEKIQTAASLPLGTPTELIPKA